MGYAGDGKNGKVGKALDLVKSEVAQVQDLYEKMSDVQRKVFISSLKGFPDELHVVLDAGYSVGITGIAKIVYTKDGKPMETHKLTLQNVTDLDAGSYERLLKIARADVSRVIGSCRNYSDYILDVKNLFKMVAPEALSTLVEVSTNQKAKNGDRIRAANSLLDRAGYGTNKQDGKDDRPPVLVQINFDKKPQAEVNPNVVTVIPENENE